jgi:hypothetical protein
MAGLRNLATSTLHRAGHTTIAKALRHTARDANRPRAPVRASARLDVDDARAAPEQACARQLGTR